MEEVLKSLKPRNHKSYNPTTPNKGWLVADNGDRMDISIMYCVKQNFRLNRWLGWKRGQFLPKYKKMSQSIISRWLSICVQSFVQKTCQLYGLLHCPVQHNAIFVPVCVCLRLLVLSSCVSVSLGLWVSLCVCVFVCTCNDLRHVTSPLVGEVSIPPTTLCACSFRKEISDFLFCF